MNGIDGQKTYGQTQTLKFFCRSTRAVFPLGTKADETWHSGYYPIAWTNKKYNMLYTNWGHNDIDYENKTNKQLSFTFGNDIQDKWIVDAILLIGSKSKRKG